MDNSQLKIQYQNSFIKLVNSNAFKSMQKKYRLNGYTFSILTSKHKKESINLLSQQFSYLGGNLIHFPLHLSPGDWNPEPIVENAIKAGISSVILDEKGKVCFVGIQKDVAIKHERTEKEKQQMSEKRKVILDIIYKHLHGTDQWYQQNIANNKYQKHGEIICGFLGATRQDLIGKNVLKFHSATNRAVLVNIKSVKYIYYDCVHPGTIHVSENVWHPFFMNVLQKKNDNNYSFISSRLNVYKYYKNRFKKDEIFKQQFDENDIMNRLSGFKRHEIITYVIRFDQLRKHYTMEQVFEMFTDFILKRKAKL